MIGCFVPAGVGALLLFYALSIAIFDVSDTSANLRRLSSSTEDSSRTRIVKACASHNCNSCADDPAVCSECKNSWYLHQSYCFESCPDGYVTQAGALGIGGKCQAESPEDKPVVEADTTKEPDEAPLKAPKQLEIVAAIPDPHSGKVDFIYRKPDGDIVESNKKGKIWEKEINEEERETRFKQKLRRHMMNLVISLIIGGTFAVVYKQKVVDKILKLEQRPVSTDKDFRHGIFECIYPEPQWHVCLHAWCCMWCRAAHTWHVAQLCEFYPALFLLTLAYASRFCCLDPCIYAYYRVKLKEKLGIEPDPCMDCVYSLFCPCCATAQEAMAVDEELGVVVKCCCDLQSPARIGSDRPMGRGAPLNLTNPHMDYSNDHVAGPE